VNKKIEILKCLKILFIFREYIPKNNMSQQKRYKKYSSNNNSGYNPGYNYNAPVPNAVILPQGYSNNVADFTPRTVYVNNTPTQYANSFQPRVVIVKQPVIGLVLNPYTGLYEYKVIG